MPFDIHGNVILTRDAAENGLRAGDIGVVERHMAPGVGEEGYYSVESSR